MISGPVSKVHFATSTRTLQGRVEEGTICEVALKSLISPGIGSIELHAYLKTKKLTFAFNYRTPNLLENGDSCPESQNSGKR